MPATKQMITYPTVSSFSSICKKRHCISTKQRIISYLNIKIALSRIITID